MVNDINCPSQNSQTVLVCFGEHEAAKLCCVQSSASCKASRRAKLHGLQSFSACKASRHAKLSGLQNFSDFKALRCGRRPGDPGRVRASAGVEKFCVIPSEFGPSGNFV